MFNSHLKILTLDISLPGSLVLLETIFLNSVNIDLISYDE